MTRFTAASTRRIGATIFLCAGLGLIAAGAGCAKDPPGLEGGGSPGTGGAPTLVGGSGGAAVDPDAGPPGPRNPVADHGPLQVVGTKLVDQSGNPVQLKGVSSMWLNWESHTYAESKPALQYARDNWKLSVIRAAMGVDATGGYLTGASGMANMQNRVETIVQNAIDLGIYVIVDWHTGKATTQTTDAVNFFTTIATKFGNTPNIIYEPYNEPTGVTWAQIKPYHEAVVAAIRAVDADNVIVLGTPNYSQDVDTAAQDPVAGTNLLYTLHFYACTHKQALRDKGNLALMRGIGLFITEFGATPADGGLVSKTDNNVCEVEANNWFSWMASNDISGASWKLEQCTDSSCILTPTAPVDGPWTDDVLTTDAGGTPVSGGTQGGGHGLFVVNWMRN